MKGELTSKGRKATRTYLRNHKTRLGALREVNRIERDSNPNVTAELRGPFSDGGWVAAVTYHKRIGG